MTEWQWPERKEARCKQYVARERTEHVGLVVKQGTLLCGDETAATNTYTIDEDESEQIEETLDHDDELQVNLSSG